MKHASKFLIALCMLAACVSVHAALINVNTASPAELDTLPGIGPVIVARIVAYRTANGPFASVEDIEEVKGIGPKTFDGIKDLITVGYVAPETKPTPKPASNPVIPQASAADKEPVARTSVVAAVGESSPQFPIPASVIGLLGLVGLGALGAYYLRKPREEGEETPISADEFDIE